MCVVYKANLYLRHLYMQMKTLTPVVYFELNIICSRFLLFFAKWWQ